MPREYIMRGFLVARPLPAESGARGGLCPSQGLVRLIANGWPRIWQSADTHVGKQQVQLPLRTDGINALHP
jgi:hypothetical protein